MPATPARRRPQHSDSKILGAASRVFSRVGYEAATLNAIAAESGTTKPTLYARFGSKDGLYLATLRHESGQLAERLLSAYGEAEAQPVADLVETAVRAWFEYADQCRDGFTLLFVVALHGPGQEQVRALRAEVTERIVELLRGAAPAPEAVDEATVEMLGAMIVGSCVEGAIHMLESDLGARRATLIATDFIFGTYPSAAAEQQRD